MDQGKGVCVRDFVVVAASTHDVVGATKDGAERSLLQRGYHLYCTKSSGSDGFIGLKRWEGCTFRVGV